MAVILSHESALAFWRLVRSQLCSSVRSEPCAPASFGMPSRSRAEALRLSRRPLPQALNPLPDACATRNEIARLHDVFGDDALELLFTDGCLHACVPSVRHGVDRWSDSPGRPGAPSGVVRMHSSDSLYPTGAFSMVAPDVYVSSPALCFCQLGESADLSQMVEVGSELCGSYSVCGSQAARESLDASDSWDSAGAPSCVFGIDRLIKPSTLARQVERMPRIRGKGVATKALSYVLDGSGSPRETKLGIMLSFPRARGGFGLPVPEMNGRIRIPGNTARAAGSSFYTCDLLWRSQRVAVEYDSDAFHAGADRIERDALRRDMLEDLGFSVLTVTKRRLSSLQMLEDFANELRRALGVRSRRLTPKQEVERRLLHRELMGSR